MRTLLPMTLGLAALVGCGDAASSSGDPDPTPAPDAPPVELTPALCDDPSKMASLLESLSSGGGGPTYGEVNLEQLQRMIAAPTRGPFYMVNLIRFRERAEYPDGRESELTGREANDLYAPGEFLTAIGARPVFVGNVEDTILGEAGHWDQVAIVEYPCPLATLAMSAHPEFQARSIHKDAGVEASTVMVTHFQPPEDGEVGSPPMGEGDVSIERVQVFRHREEAQYAAAANEPARSGREAMTLHDAGTRDAEARLGARRTARLAVQGVFVGDGRAWDEVRLDAFPSRAALDALASDPAAEAAEHHREAALAEAYGLSVEVQISDFAGAEAASSTPE